MMFFWKQRNIKFCDRLTEAKEKLFGILLTYLSKLYFEMFKVEAFSRLQNRGIYEKPVKSALCRFHLLMQNKIMSRNMITLFPVKNDKAVKR